MSQDALILIRSELRERIDRIAAWAVHDSPAAMHAQVEGIRREARRHGMSEVTELAAHLAHTLTIGHPGPSLSTYVELMRDAVDCAGHHQDAGAVYMAALSNRMGIA